MIGIIAAMELERDALEKRMQGTARQTISGISFTLGKLAGRDVVLMLSGVGKGYAAMATTILLEHFAIASIINIGTAGGIRPEEHILDIVISEQVVQHDFDTSPIDGEAGIGMYFEADTKLVDAVRKAIQEEEHEVFVGLIASGDRFVTAGEHMERIVKQYPKAMCCEMEAGAVAQVASHYHCPFVVVRSLSDVACHANSHMDFLQYASVASKRSAAFVERAVSNFE